MSIVNPTPSLSLERQITGTNQNTWGDRENANWARVDQTNASTSVDVSAGDVVLSVADSADVAADAQARYGMIVATGTPAAPVSVIWPSAVVKPYILFNSTGQVVTYKVAGLTGVSVKPGEVMQAFCGVDLVTVAASAAALAASIAASPVLSANSLGAAAQWTTGYTRQFGVRNPDPFGSPQVVVNFPTQFPTQFISGGATIANASTAIGGIAVFNGNQSSMSVVQSFSGGQAAVLGFYWWAEGY